MRALFILLMLTASSFFNDLVAQDVDNESTIIILVRHAEKAGNDPRDPDLSVAGLARAKRLAALLSDVQVDELYSTPLKRTRQTVQFIASQRGKETMDYDPRNLKDLADMLRGKPGKTILVAGHSNTTPTLANLLLGEDKFQQLPESEYGKIWFITYYNNKPIEVLVLNY